MRKTWEESYQNLLLGNYEEGWPDHESIPVYNKEGVTSASSYGLPIWCGEREPITLLVNAEFGDGDTIQYYRFVSLAKERVNKVILRCNSEFSKLFTDVEISSNLDDIPQADKIIHMMALPKVLSIKNSQLNGKPYINPNPNEICRETQVLSLLKMNKFGINWAGNPFNPRDYMRSIPIELFSALDVDQIKFFSLNKLYMPPNKYFDCRGLMYDWNQTAHLISLMDLVITVETSIACLAGALGVPVWVLVPTEQPEYRWGLEGSTTVWYDSMKLYRKKGSWQETLEVLAVDFKEHLKKLCLEQSFGAVCAPSSDALNAVL